MKCKRSKIGDHIVLLVSLLLLFGCATTTTGKREAKIPEKHRTVICGGIKKDDVGSFPDDIRNSYIKQKGNKSIYVFTEWYDLTPNAEYNVKWEYYNEDRFVASNIRKFSSSTHEYMTAGRVSLDPKYNIPTGIITSKIYINDVYITLQRKFSKL